MDEQTMSIVERLRWLAMHPGVDEIVLNVEDARALLKQLDRPHLRVVAEEEE